MTINYENLTIDFQCSITLCLLLFNMFTNITICEHHVTKVNTTYRTSYSIVKILIKSTHTFGPKYTGQIE